MATKKISELTAGAAVADADILAAVQAGATVKVTSAQVLAYVQSKTKFAASVGDGSAVQYDVTHNLGTRDVIVGVYRAVAPFDVVLPDVQHLDVNTVRLIFASAPPAAQYRAVIRA